MASIFLIVTAVIMALLILGFTVMTVIYFSHPDDKDEHVLPKIIVVRWWCPCVRERPCAMPIPIPATMLSVSDLVAF